MMRTPIIALHGALEEIERLRKLAGNDHAGNCAALFAAVPCDCGWHGAGAASSETLERERDDARAELAQVQGGYDILARECARLDTSRVENAPRLDPCLCNHGARQHAIDDQELRECSVCECHQYENAVKVALDLREAVTREAHAVAVLAHNAGTIDAEDAFAGISASLHAIVRGAP